MSTDARIIDPETLQELPQGEAGEIIICGPEVFKGYWKRPDATAQAFIEHRRQALLPLRRPGPRGRGRLLLHDRPAQAHDQCVSGFKVWPAEVEALMFRHPAIQEACIISTKDAYRGESVKAVVVLRQSHRGQVQRAGHHRLVPRQHGRLQGAARGAVRRGPAQERQRQGDVAHAAGDWRGAERGFSSQIGTVPSVEWSCICSSIQELLGVRQPSSLCSRPVAARSPDPESR